MTLIHIAPGTTLVIATHNPGKVTEIAQLLAGTGVEVIAAGQLGLAEPEETGSTFAANAELKAVAAALASGHPALADDSGLVVDGLGGDPGIYSARWAGPAKDFGLAMDKVLRGLDSAPTRTARFVCALSLALPGGQVYTVEGTVEGVIAPAPKGANGFGYDPIFIADGHTVTFGEMEPAAKHAISHRARAFAQLVQDCFG